jgi:hypothetical protein
MIFHRRKGYVMYSHIYLIYQVEFLVINSFSLPSTLLLTKSVVGNYLYEGFNYMWFNI